MRFRINICRNYWWKTLREWWDVIFISLMLQSKMLYFRRQYILEHVWKGVHPRRIISWWFYSWAWMNYKCFIQYGNIKVLDYDPTYCHTCNEGMQIFQFSYFHVLLFILLINLGTTVGRENADENQSLQKTGSILLAITDQRAPHSKFIKASLLNSGSSPWSAAAPLMQLWCL